ncbi:MAG: carboxypeptidase-like regulatory domain-containing protein, partial [Longimicrobiales bacterium]
MSVLLTVLLVLPLVSAAEAVAQEQAIRGRVVSAETREPLADAQIQIVGTDQGGLSQTNGIFLLQGVTGNQITLRVTLLGYRTVEQVVQVGDMDVELVLEPMAVA